ncbi:MAG TPA: hypothetical protein VHZ98_10755 [Galbitalea sp.]|jgi:hypothetical protein|nr:hypothetical protein [Galbitalea sp.]
MSARRDGKDEMIASDPDNIPSGAGQGDKDSEDDTSSGGAPEQPRE